jgi:hypothetical protein
VFTCVVQPSARSTVKRRFEAEAGDPLQAVQDVLNQIDDWRSR